jgi:hypothetical protein
MSFKPSDREDELLAEVAGLEQMGILHELGPEWRWVTTEPIATGIQMGFMGRSVPCPNLRHAGVEVVADDGTLVCPICRPDLDRRSSSAASPRSDLPGSPIGLSESEEDAE